MKKDMKSSTSQVVAIKKSWLFSFVARLVSDVPTATDSKRANHETLFLVSTYGGGGGLPFVTNQATSCDSPLEYDFAFDWCLGLKQARSK
jgi:hypothetical protein